MFGSSLASRAIPSAPIGVTGGIAAPRPSQLGVAGRRALVTIRFDQANVDYEQPLFNAIKQALERRPDAYFDVVGVSPTSSNQGRAALDPTHRGVMLRRLFGLWQTWGCRRTG